MSSAKFAWRKPVSHTDLKAFPKPDTEIIPEQEAIFHANLAAISFGRAVDEAQHPEVAAISCSRIDLPTIFDVRKLGWMFRLASPGARLSEQGVGSATYPFLHLKPPHPSRLIGTVHSCTQKGRACRNAVLEPLEHSHEQMVPLSARGRALQAQGLDLNKGFEGLKKLELAAPGVPQEDRDHARSRIIKVLTSAPELQALVARGELIVAESYYQGGDGKVISPNDGKVHWLTFWGSSNPGAGFNTEVIQAIVEGRIRSPQELANYHRGYQALQALVYGNDTYQRDFELPMPTTMVIDSCADSRMNSIILKAPNGLVEWFHSAGNGMDNKKLAGLAIACEGAAENAWQRFQDHGSEILDPEGYRRRAVLAVFSHSSCGAVDATLHHCCGKHGDHPIHDDPAAPIVENLSPRFAEYLAKHPDPWATDGKLIEAAEANAVGACIEIMRSTSPGAEAIRRLVREDKLIIVPGFYGLRTGVIRQLPPLDHRTLEAQSYGGLRVAANA